MKSKYIKYSIEQLADEKQFIDWVSKGDYSEEWEELIRDNSDFANKAAEARELVLLLQDHSNVLDKKDELEMWSKIENFSREQTPETRSLKIRRSLYWAASILLFISIGSLAYIYLGEKNTTYQFVSSVDQQQSNNTRLLLSDGEEISLASYNSKLSLNNDSELVLNNDTIIHLSNAEHRTNRKVQMNELVIPFGKKSELLLADGTKVWLNAGSHFAFPNKFSEENRRVFLEGEAYFEVAENVMRPFIVNASLLEVKVLGTRFNISAHTNDNVIETILLEGSVALRKATGFGSGKDEVILKPYEKGSFDKQKSNVSVSAEPNADIYITWTEGMFQFSKEDLPAIFSKLERFYNVEIEISPNVNVSRLISGKLDLKESIEDVMAALGDVAKIEYRIEENIIYIDKNENR